MSDEQNFERFKKCAVDVLSVEAAQVLPEATFESLDADSLDLVELVMALEEEFDVNVEEEELEGVTDIQGAMLEPTAVAINAIDETRFSAGQTMLVVGAGPIGALTALAARAAGASKIYIYDPNEARLAHLAKFPEFSVFSGDPDEVLSIIADETESGIGVDVAVECAGHSSALDLCIEATKRTGHIALVGLITGRTPVDLFKVCEKGLRMIGCWGNDFTLGSRLVAMIESGRLPVESLVTGIVTLDRAISDGFDVLSEAENDHLKILIDMRV